MAAAPVRWVDLGLTGYQEAFAVQELLHQRLRSGREDDVIIFQENYPVFTLGRFGREEHFLVARDALQARGIAVVDVNRGGDVTFHGPGQLVASPLVRLRERGWSVHQYVRQLEQVVIDLLARHGVGGRRIEGASGVWVGDSKIAALGIAVRHGVTQHGVSINVNPDLAFYQLIVPCGLKNRGVTSLVALGARGAVLGQVRDEFLADFSRVFEVPIAAGEFSLRGEEKDDC